MQLIGLIVILVYAVIGVQVCILLMHACILREGGREGGREREGGRKEEGGKEGGRDRQTDSQRV